MADPLPGELKADEGCLREILDGMSDAVIGIDSDWRIVYANAACMELGSPLLQSADPLVGQNLWEKFPGIAGSEAGAFCERAMAEQRARTLELYCEPLRVWLHLRAHPSPRMLSICVQDISERKRREAGTGALTQRLETQIFEATLSNTSGLAYSFDREGRVLYANRPLLELWGKTLPEVLGRTVFDLGYPDDLAHRLHGQLMEVVKTGRAVRGETTFTSVKGVADIHDHVCSPVFDSEGAVVAIAGSIRLITESRNAERAMRQLAAIVEFSHDAIISKDLDGVITTWNAGAERLFGYSAEEMVGRPMLTIIPEDRHGEEPVILRRIRNGERIEHYETIRRRKDGTLVMVSLSVSPIRDSDGRIVGASKIARDITQQKQAETALREAKDAAEAANRSKDHFLAMLSHELRTPLNPVLMTASALEDDPAQPAPLRADMAMIRRNIELETNLIDDLLDLSRITSGKLALHVRPLDVNDAVRQVEAICGQQIQGKNIRLDLDLADDAGLVRADPARLQQVLWNILKNALKFTPEGGNVRIATQRAEGEVVRISISDSGIGIAPEVLPGIFDAFDQGDANTARQFGGLGLGLAITKALVVLHSGSISAESKGAGRGSTFRVELPVAAAGSAFLADSEILEPRAGEELRVLIVEDHADTAAMLARLLGASGYDVAVANSAAEGLEISAGAVFDIVVSDIGLPDSTGYEFMKKLRTIRKIKGIAMSGYGMEEDIRRSLEAGFSEHLVKPVSLLSLQQAIHRLASGGAA